jgi:hypothetical protein
MQANSLRIRAVKKKIGTSDSKVKCMRRARIFLLSFQFAKIHGEESSDIGPYIYCSLHNGYVLKT